MYVQFSPVWPWQVLAVVAILLLGAAHWTYQKYTPNRKLLLTLRWISVLLALYPMLRPNLVTEKKHKKSAVLAILADKSRSMMLRDMWKDQSRWEAIKHVMKEADADLKALGEDVEIREFQFSRKISESIGLDQEPTGEQTALGDALVELTDKFSTEKLAGVILLSDGTNTFGQPPSVAAHQMAGPGVPIFAFGFGQETANDQIRDLAAQTILSNPTAFVKTKLSLQVGFSALGFANKSVPVRVLVNGVEQKKTVLNIGADATRSFLDTYVTSNVPGDVKISVIADVQPNEMLPNNNRIDTFVTVLSGGISVLYIEGKIRFWEPKFVRWAIDQSRDIELTQFFLLNAGGQKNEIPADLFKPGKYDVIILGDLNSNQLPATQLEALKGFVEKGGGLMMIGGYESFGPGGWGDSAVGSVLPVIVRPTDGQLQQPLQMIPTESGLRHFIMRLGSQTKDTKDVWQSLRPLDGGSQWSGVKPGAVVLGATPENMPLLVAQDVGAGRSIASAVDTTWRWRRNNDGMEAHARFWRQLILWLAKKDEAGDAQVHVKLGSRRLAVGQRLPVEVKVVSPDNTPLKSSAVKAVVRSPDGKELPLELVRQGDDFRGGFLQTDTPGDYEVVVTATDQGKDLGSKTVKFLTYAEDNEMRQPAADISALRSIAEITGGEYHSAEEFPKFIQELRNRKLNVEVQQLVYDTLWDRWEVLALFVLVLAAEWFIRKRRGLA